MYLAVLFYNVPWESGAARLKIKKTAIQNIALSDDCWKKVVGELKK